MGRLGQKTGAGWYRYQDNDRTPSSTPVQEIIKTVVGELGITRKELHGRGNSAPPAVSSVNEACKILQEGKALRASDIDVMWLNGFWLSPLPWRFDVFGPTRSVPARCITRWRSGTQRYGARWRPSELLQQLAESGGSLREITARLPT